MQHILNLLETQGYREGGILRFEEGGGAGEGPGGDGAGSGSSGGSAEGTAARAGMGFGGTGSGIGGDNSAGSGNNSVGLSDISSMLNSISPLASVIPAVRAPMALANAAISAISAISSVANGDVSVGDAISKLTKDGLMGFISKETGLSAAAISSAMNGDLGDAAKAQTTASLTKALNKAGLGAANAAIGAISRAGGGDGSSGPTGSGGGSSKTLNQTNALNTNPDVIVALNNAGLNTQTPTGDVASFVKNIQNTATFNPDPLGVLKKRYTPKNNANSENTDIFNKPIVESDVNSFDSNDLIDRLYAS